MEIAAAFVIGRQEAMAKSGATTPFGRGYTPAFGEWLDEHPKFKAIKSPTRWFLFQCWDNREAVEQWRTNLDPKEHLEWNHPKTVYIKWASTNPLNLIEKRFEPKIAKKKSEAELGYDEA
jgi:hypothetical protein